jgi:ATP-dependent helicase/nuclease subunit B
MRQLAVAFALGYLAIQLMHDLNNKKKLFDLLAQGATIITPNNRLSAALLQQYFTSCNHKSIDKPGCYPYTTAISKAYQHLKFQSPAVCHPVVLNNAQCQYMWRKIIQSHAEITFSEGLLHSVMEAWKHCLQWQISPEHQAFHYTPQTRQFQSWWRIFDKQLQDIKAISEHQLVPYLINSESTSFQEAVVWVCFDEFNPQQISLQRYLSQQGVAQYRYDLPEQSSQLQLFSAADNKEEYQQLMAWLHLKISQGKQKIGVVIPDLAQESRHVQRRLAQHFDTSLFNVSLGQPLSEFPIMSHALTWLQLNPLQLSHHEASLLLQSPYLGGAKEEFIQRSHYLQESTLLQEQTVPLKSFMQNINTYTPKLTDLLDALIPYPTKATPQEWIALFQNRLSTMGFPGDYGLNSENYQCFNRFITLLDEFRQFTVITSHLSQEEALNTLTYLLDNTIFQAQKSNAPIQISGLLEASGCEFDSLWVMGLTDQCLPQKVQLSAFIPPQLQRELNMPHSLPERELNYARQTLQRLERGSKDSVFSFSRLLGDTPNLPCSLIADLPDFAPLPDATPQEQPSLLMSFEESYDLPITVNESISGGTSLLANQAKCPFKAFAEHRLKAKPSLQTTDGLDPKEKGIVAHKVMELLWRELQNQQNLLRMSTQELDQCIDKAIQIALDPLKKEHPDSFPQLVQEVEYTRLKRLIVASLDWEKSRPPFEVSALEESFSVHLAGLDFKVRVDRLDQVNDRKWLIDYKSNLPLSKPWNEERPQEPQLLLYALLDEQINTLLLMQLKTGKVLCNGLSEEKLDVKGVSALKKEETWEQCRADWLEQLSQLSEEFQKGYCPPKPTKTTLCEHCDFQNLCRT